MAEYIMELLGWVTLAVIISAALIGIAKLLVVIF